MLGEPSDITKLEPVEQWSYKASNGTVVFLILGDKVTPQTAGNGSAANYTEGATPPRVCSIT